MACTYFEVRDFVSDLVLMLTNGMHAPGAFPPAHTTTTVRLAHKSCDRGEKKHEFASFDGLTDLLIH